jgi:catalase-peroxidase
MNDSETVALIGGGHAFGKTHGACPNGAGPDPMMQPRNPWPGKCGTGKGKDAFTSGFEGPWTTKPTTWDNEYFKNLRDYTWEPFKGPGGHYQWRVKDGKTPQAPGAFGGLQNIMLLTSDVSLTKDPTGKFQPIVEQFANDMGAFSDAFAHAWYKLTTRDMGPVSRCLGDDVPPPQPFQYPLPDPPAMPADFAAVAKAIHKVTATHASLGPLFVRLAFACASTYRQTDYRGGCNGARIRFGPESKWSSNRGLDLALKALQPVFAQFPKLSWADLIVLAGTVAVGEASQIKTLTQANATSQEQSEALKFCGGRTDLAAYDGGSADLQSRVNGTNFDTMEMLREQVNIWGLTAAEFVALMGGHSIGSMHVSRSGFNGSWTADPTKLDNSYFVNLLGETWEPTVSPQGYYKAHGKDLYMLNTDLLLRDDAEYLALAQDYASDNALFVRSFASAWTKVMNADRYDGPTGSKCAQ